MNRHRLVFTGPSLFLWALFGIFGASAASAQQDSNTLLPHNPQCTIRNFVPVDDHVRDEVFQQLTPTGTLIAGINYGNPNNATRDAAGLLHGVAVDMACVLARHLGVEVQFIGYPGVPPLMQGLANGEFTIGFTQDPELGPTNIAYANPHIGVENTYLVPVGSLIQTVADADQPGIRISVASGNAPDVYLTAHLQFAQLVRFATVPQALAALKKGAVDAFAGSRSAEVAFVSTQMPGGRILTENIFIAHLAQVLPLGLPDALRYLNRFVEAGKISFLIQFAVCRAGLIGVSVPPPSTISKQHDSEENLSVKSGAFHATPAGRHRALLLLQAHNLLGDIFDKSLDGGENSDLYLSKRTNLTGPH